MVRRTRPLLSLALTAVLALAAGAVGGALPAYAGTTSMSFVDITAADGVILKANVVESTTPGRHPAVVFPSSWGLNDLEYIAQATAMAAAGYTVLSYTPRGWWASGGTIDTAGPKDIADARSVIDWLIAHTSADPARIGMGGVSYGAGISLIASAFDSRVRAVAAMSGWTDLAASLYGDQTRRQQAPALLQGAALLLGRTSAEFNAVIDDFWNYRNIPGVLEFARIRSAKTYLSAINTNRPAILMANAYGDSVFPPNQLVDFFGQLTTPKRLEFSPGDHAIPELTGIAGLDNAVWTSARRWFDRHLAGIANGIDTEAPILLRPNGGGAAEAYASWPAVATSTPRRGLQEIQWWDGTGNLGGSATTGWSRFTWTDLGTSADGGVVLLSNGLTALTGEPPTAWLPGVDRGHAAVWVSSSLGSTLKVRGIPTVHLRVTPSASNGTLIAYLYDVDWTGTGSLLTHAPISWRGASAGSALTLDLRLPATAWNVPAGHKLALVVDGHDPLYLDDNGALANATFSGQAWVDIPQR
ncbi:MAG: alpha/beta hydrolase fold domain-containing protein [Hamadaea sp.]|nr:alpha/beta hydrolase fold domain-containing protein [Hamadaea sp.]